VSLIGRAPELTALSRACARAREGAPSAVGVLGPAGFGKTALLHSASTSARGAGFLVASACAAAHEQAVPFAPLRRALEEQVARLGPARVAVAGPQLGAVVPAAQGDNDAELGGPAERHRIHDAVRALLEQLGHERPVALVLDDAHLADEASIEALSALLRRPPSGPVLVIVGMEPGAIAERLLAAGRDAPGWEELTLGGLHGDEAAALVPRRLSADDRARVLAAAGDSPLLLGELARGAGDTLDGVVGGELAALAPDARALAEGASAVGDPFDLDVAAAAAGLSRDAATTAATALVMTGVVRRAQRARILRFRHPLVQRAIAGAMAPEARRLAHDRAAFALLAMGAEPAVVAYHVEQFAQPGDEGAGAMLVAAAEAAGDRSPGAAAHWYAAALALLPEDDGAARAAMLAPLAQALAATGRRTEARTALGACTALIAAQVAPDHAVARTARRVGEALELAATGRLTDAPWTAGAELGRDEHYVQAVDALQRGLHAARTDRRDHLLLHFHGLLSRFAVPLLELDVAFEHAEAAVASARLQDLRRELAVALALHARVLAVGGDRAAAERAATESDALLRTLGRDPAVRTALAHNATVRFAGDPERLLAELTATGGPRLEHLDPSAVTGLLLTATRAAVELGRLDQAERWAEVTVRIADGPQRPASAVRGVRARAEVLLARGQPRAAARLATSAVNDAERLGLRQEELGARLLAGRALHASGQHEAARIELQRVAGDAERLDAIADREAAERELLPGPVPRSGPGRQAHARSTGVGALSDRERSVAALVAEGRTNREVAAALYLSEKTVEANLTRIYEKLGVRSRTELAGNWSPGFA
jgi:DNA-binding NarL/FixJ family response regulator